MTGAPSTSGPSRWARLVASAVFDSFIHSPVTVIADPAACAFQFDPVGKTVFNQSCDLAKSYIAKAGVNYTNVAAPAGTVAEVRIGNDVVYGLAAGVWTQNMRRAFLMSEKLQAGTVWVNCFFVRDLRAPFGGSRKSGIGREGGVWSFDFYADVKNTCYSPNGWR